MSDVEDESSAGKNIPEEKIQLIARMLIESKNKIDQRTRS